MDRFRKRIKTEGGERIVSRLPLLFKNVPAAVSPELWDWTGLGLPLVPADKGRQGQGSGASALAANSRRLWLSTAQHQATVGDETDRERAVERH